MPAAKVFLTGGTGYIGGSVLATLLQYPNKYTITALIRSKSQAAELKKLGVTPVIGDLDSLDLLAKHAQASDAVIHTAHADHLPSAQALVRGLKAKKDKRAVFLHNSGTGVLCYSRGPTEIPFDDEDIDRIHSIPITSPHKNVDAWIFDNTDDITAAIICPSTINGIGSGPFKKTSQQVIGLAKAAVGRKKAGWVGESTTVRWGNVNIHDLSELFRIVLDGLLSNTIESGSKGGFYFGSYEEHTWHKVVQGLGEILHRKGLVDSSEVSQFEKKYADKYLGGDDAKIFWVGDSRCVANRSKKIGWKPCHPNVYETLEQEVTWLIESGELHN